jgi:negative regulator of replication initiation
VKTITISDDVYAAIQTVLRGLLGLPEKDQDNVPPITEVLAPLDEFIQSRDYAATTTADEKYLKLISWLLRKHSELATRLDGSKMPKRIYFATVAKVITDSGQNVKIKAVPEIDFAFFAMVTLDNRRKRKIMRCVLILAGYDQCQIERVLVTLPDSGITRGKARLADLMKEYDS